MRGIERQSLGPPLDPVQGVSPAVGYAPICRVGAQSQCAGLTRTRSLAYGL